MKFKRKEILSWLNHKLVALRLKFGIKSLKDIETTYKKRLDSVTLGISMLMKKRKHIREVLTEIKNTKDLLRKELE